jgi:hypothetical protein
MWVVVIVVIGRYLTKNKTTVAICDSGFNDLTWLRASVKYNQRTGLLAVR